MTPAYLPKDYDIFLGIDVDKNSFSFTVQDHNTMSKAKTIPSQPEQLYNYVKNQFADKKVLFAYEAGPTGYHLHDYLSVKEQDCLVASPLSIPRAPNQKVKNNRIDSRKIVEELKAGKLKSIRVPHGPYRELRHLINLRENYAHSRKVAKQRIKALLLYTHLCSALKDIEQNWSNNYIRVLKELPCSNAVRQRLNMLLMDLEYARRQTLSILGQLRMFIKSHKEIQQYMYYLVSIPGIGFITAVTVLGRIGDPGRLRNVRELSAFVGLVPTEKSTGDDVNRGSITHLGDSILRSLLIEASWSAIRKDRELNQFYFRIKSRHHPKIAARKAIVAVARKLTQRIYRILKEQRLYVVH
jgi:transposase